ncbi:hepatic sodium/bile acid cotransporter [Stomoxys calcitrans]|uniref:hepatic sodium/bile acid cotransporter n=1 Tax=Stomoxys calcitrans TaxID=35570 RepID=UPI0027E35D2B|nr:hepatic sodium/bile acid cotransporter [Stomoxys calcitrans]XP_013105484.2 hepatic sodium/bile acid cotransporter [Stomoxys calcitrans]XP_013105485.2 hepatic sodium/bile acid cotransporter [Stomoxys calcitrans]XP_013105486.2 hepatic sodium/bile acid cotransporter [Stomoxys calcitrans]XP_013105487.2 hepatic sodium/bile acid cotransporter [Stomoxys calcitrans]XP_059222911.1 hepatic sodium/bile acid cotransporter [Stomoxys calcitrans]
MNSLKKLLVLCVLITQLLDLSHTQSIINGTSPLEDEVLFTLDDFVSGPAWSVSFSEKKLNMSMTDISIIQLTITDIDPAWGSDYEFHILAEDNEVVLLTQNVIKSKDIKPGDTTWHGNFTAEGLFIGHSPIYVELRRPQQQPEVALEKLQLIVLRKIGTMDYVFQILVGIFVMALYTNFGAVLELDALKQILIRPIGPLIGFLGQFVVMPVLSFFIGYLLFRDMIELRLGLFFTGSTPGGGASNIFTVVLNGNLNLSITMTAISNLAAFGMMPLWIFTLGALIFKDGNLVVPYKTIATMSFSLVIPLSIGIAMQKYYPNMAKKMSKLLKPFAFGFILIIMVFAFTVNSYMFKLFSWKILIASSALPWIGYVIGWLMAIICRQSPRDALTIAIETGIQNTGIAIFMLNFALPQPQADMTSAVPVASSMVTPLPLLVIYVIRKIFCRSSMERVEKSSSAITKDTKLAEIEAMMEKSEKSDWHK